MKSINIHITILLALCLLFVSCSPREIREAKHTVTLADSLWHAGTPCDDSTSLAQAYETLGALPFPFREVLGVGSTYAHACYHYGRLLRQKENPVEAMQVFINATHSHTSDYHILGRIYSNMGDIAHLANEFELSYDMYKRSGEMFLYNGDSLNYYYAMNDMALELAEQGRKEDALALLNEIENLSIEDYLIAKVWETKAELYRITAQYDSAIYCINEKCALGYVEPTDILIKAQAYDNLNQKDSALIYANSILTDFNASYQNKFNALYIVLHNDSTLSAEDISTMASEREDIRYNEYELIRERCVAAVQLLNEDLHKSLEWSKWALSLLSLVSGIVIIIITKKLLIHKHRAHDQITALTDERAENITESIKNHIAGKDFRQTLHWNDYSAMKADVDLYMGGLAKKLESHNLNEVQIRFCVLTMLDFPLRKIAKEMHYSYPSAIKTLKKRTSDKLGTKPPDLKEFLLRL